MKHFISKIGLLSDILWLAEWLDAEWLDAEWSAAEWSAVEWLDTE
jgi:hypothetical protein